MKKILFGFFLLSAFFWQNPVMAQNSENNSIEATNYQEEAEIHEHEESAINESFLEKIQELFENESIISIFYILAIIFLLGLFHPLQPGHGKSILFAYLIEKKRSPKEEFIFISTMTFSHIFDLIILGILLNIFLININSHELLHWLQKATALILLMMSIYYLGKNFIKKKKNSLDHCHKCQCENHSKSKGPILAFIAGIVPCAIGWSIIIILLNLNQEAWIIPSIAIFALGVWLSLFIMTKIISTSREFFEKKMKNISKITNIISPLILLIIALFLIFG